MENSTTPREEELAILEVDLFDRIEIQTVLNVSENASCLWEHDNITRHCTVDKDRKTYSFLISQANERHAGIHQLSFQSSSVSYSMRFAVRVRILYFAYFSSYRRTYKFCDHHQTPGKYDFYADNKDSRMNRSMQLYKKEKPRLSLKPEFEGKVQCIGEGYPAPEMTWWKCGFSDNCSAEASWKKLTEKPKKPKYESQLKMVQLLGPSDNDYIYIDFSHVEYDQKWEFPRENLEIGKELGSGAFGKVVEATAYGISKPGVSEQVAVKMLKEKFQPSEKEALMSELKMMTHIGTHENIVNLLGACTVTGPVYLIFQYCPYGDLLNYLRINREQFHKTLTDVFTQNHFSLYHNFQPDHTFRDGSSTHSGSYVPMHRIRDTASTEESDILLSASDPAHCACHEECDSNYQNTRKNLDEELHVLTFEDLLSFSYQVAKGMEFLTERNCIHRDLAARNVLVTHEKVVKIGDFGLARDIMNDSNYIVKGNSFIHNNNASLCCSNPNSDSHPGVNPYPGIQVDQSFYKLIQNGFKMEQPYYSTESVYQMMQSCWTLDARKRPGFSQIVSFMESQLSDAEAAYAYCAIPVAAMYVSYLLDKEVSMYPSSVRHSGLNLGAQNFVSPPQYPDYGTYHVPGVNLDSATQSAASWHSPYGPPREEWSAYAPVPTNGAHSINASAGTLPYCAADYNPVQHSGGGVIHALNTSAAEHQAPSSPIIIIIIISYNWQTGLHALLWRM
ncbi:UNVERIFIED_CONTAM: hypothetical protein FKN15_000865 [Acipenser sinensis]